MDESIANELNEDTIDENVPIISPEHNNIRRRRAKLVKENTQIGSMNVISGKYESLDYDTCENAVYLEEERKKGYKYIVKKNLYRWIIFLLIGMLTALIGVFIDISINELGDIKYKTLKKYIDSTAFNDQLYVAYLIWMVFNLVPILIGSSLVTYIEPIAGGSGIPQVKCYLNGVKMPRVVRIKTLIVKSIGVITTVLGGLAAGKEGPMIHSGAVVAAGISQGKSSSLKKDFGILSFFREDHEKRDFVSGGAAAGVAAAFGAPVGGVLFSLEEGASFWNQSLTWRIFFASMVSTFTLNVLLSTYHGYPGHLTYPGLFSFGKFEELNYELFELSIFVCIGALGGLLGALYNYLNYKLTIFRMRCVRRNALKVLEAVLISAVSGTVMLILIYAINDCKPLGLDKTKYPVQMYCSDGEYNAVAALFLQVPEASVRSLFHDPVDSMETSSLIIFVCVYYLLACWTYGISVSAGIFIPTLLTGAAWGRLCAIGLSFFFPDARWIDVRKYAVIGAAAQLGGVVRMTISLTVILIEVTGNIAFGLPLMITLITAKWIGDYFNEGIYDIHIQLSGVPLLAWEPPPLSSKVYASEVMSHPVITLRTVENVGRIVDILRRETYNGFPVVDPSEQEIKVDNISSAPQSCGHLRGLILRYQLIVLIQNKIFNELPGNWDADVVSVEMFRIQYPRYLEIKDVHITEEDRRYTIDLRPFMNPSPYVVQHVMSLPRVFRLFRALGLRHLVVINDVNQVVGVVSRKDLARYKVWRHFGQIHVEELKISANF